MMMERPSTARSNEISSGNLTRLCGTLLSKKSQKCFVNCTQPKVEEWPIKPKVEEWAIKIFHVTLPLSFEFDALSHGIRFVYNNMGLRHKLVILSTKMFGLWHFLPLGVKCNT